MMCARMKWLSIVPLCLRATDVMGFSHEFLHSPIAVGFCGSSCKSGVLAGVPLDSVRPSDPSLALGIVRVLHELEVADGSSGPSLALGIVSVLRE
jgi:hypothetical protein